MAIILYIPIITTLFAFFFSWRIFEHYRQRRSGPHLLWWGSGISIYGIGTLAESLVTLLGWHPVLFRLWYITGALLGGAPLAQGTVYLLLKRATANRLTTFIFPFFLFAATCVLLVPLKEQSTEVGILTGKVIGLPDGSWSWVRFLSPVLNTYAVIFLVGGAILSAFRYKKSTVMQNRFLGNVFIATGAILPGIGGSFSRLGYTKVLYVTEFVGLLLIWGGYRLCVKKQIQAESAVSLSSKSGELIEQKR